MQQLQVAESYLKPEKSWFHKVTAQYFGFIISTMGISINADMVETIRDWCREKKTKNGWLNIVFEFPQFLDCCNHYWQFVSKYSEKLEPLMKFTKQDDHFVWLAEHRLVFDSVNTSSNPAAALCKFNHGRAVIFETYDSDYLSAEWFLLHSTAGGLHQVVYFSKKHIPATCNYDIYALAVMRAHEERKLHSEGAEYPLQLITDPMNYQYSKAK